MVDYIANILSCFLSILLLTSIVEKLINWKKSIIKIGAYKIISKKLNMFVFFMGTAIEIYIAVKLITIHFSLIDLLLYVVLLVIYSMAIAINLYKGHVRISCGCGGVLESDKLSWRHLLRNTVLIIFGTIVYFNNHSAEFHTSEFIINLLMGANLVMLYGIVKEFILQQKRVQKIKSIIKI